jgi:hypothetical protein
MSKKLHSIYTDDPLQADDEANLYWRGKQLITERQIRVRGFERWIAVLATSFAGIGALAALIEAADTVRRWLNGL